MSVCGKDISIGYERKCFDPILSFLPFLWATLTAFSYCFHWPGPWQGVTRSEESKKCWLHFLGHFSADQNEIKYGAEMITIENSHFHSEWECMRKWNCFHFENSQLTRLKEVYGCSMLVCWSSCPFCSVWLVFEWENLPKIPKIPLMLVCGQTFVNYFLSNMSWQTPLNPTEWYQCEFSLSSFQSQDYKKKTHKNRTATIILSQDSPLIQIIVYVLLKFFSLLKSTGLYSVIGLFSRAITSLWWICGEKTKCLHLDVHKPISPKLGIHIVTVTPVMNQFQWPWPPFKATVAWSSQNLGLLIM